MEKNAVIDLKRLPRISRRRLFRRLRLCAPVGLSLSRVSGLNLTAVPGLLRRLSRPSATCLILRRSLLLYNTRTALLRGRLGRSHSGGTRQGAHARQRTHQPGRQQNRQQLSFPIR